ncbi:MAG TPA: DUF1778 domain-containing protein [Candidatus Gastranaerophilales bacterium]|nr:DUF1778 domain-containing protein [Candidatus Gastranaerophilales bacterium]
MSNLKRQQKEERIYLRVTSDQKDALERAAQEKHTSLTNFILENSYDAAQKILAEKTHFILNDDQWNAFCEALDSPPKEIPALRTLLTKPSVLDEK